MKSEDVARKVAQLGFKVFGDPYYHDVYFKDDIEFLSFSFNQGNNLDNKAIQFQETVDSEISIEQVLENHRKKYLSLVDIEFIEENGGLLNDHQGSYVFSNDNYYGRVDIHDYTGKEGVYSISYRIIKDFINN